MKADLKVRLYDGWLRSAILGYPGLAILLFLAAAAGGFWMAWSILFGDARRAPTR